MSTVFQLRTKKSKIYDTILGSCKASAAWQWFNWVADQIPANKQPLILNMDETQCKKFYNSKDGVIAGEPLARAAKKGEKAQQVTLRDTKAALSLVAVLCNDEHIQRVLPQFILGNENILPDGALPSFAG